MSGARSNRKGSSGQREAAAAFTAGTGLPARNGGQRGQRGGMDLEVPGLAARLEVKRVEQVAVASWLKQAEADTRGGEPFAVLWRGNRMPWRLIVPLEGLGAFAEAIVSARRAAGILSPEDSLPCTTPPSSTATS